MTEEVKQLTDEELKSLREVKVSLNLRGLVKGWKKLTYTAPFNIYQRLARKVEGVSKKMMTGNASVVGFPIGIILRNTSRAGYNASRSKYAWSASIVGGLATAYGAFLTVSALAPIIAGAIGIGGVLGAGLGIFAASTAVLPLLTLAYSAATLGASTVIAAGAAAFSTLVSAPLNLIVGLRRSKASMKGVKLTDDQIAAQEEAFNRRSPTVRYHGELIEQMNKAIMELPVEKLEGVRESLQDKFDKAQKKSEAAAAKAERKAKGAAPTV